MLKEKEKEKWLGDMIHSGGCRASTLASISERKGRVYNAINETLAIIEDTRVSKLGSARFAVDVWEVAIIPILLNNADVWEVTDKEVQKELEAIQSSYFKGVLQVPNSVPKPAICYEADIQQMKFRMFRRLLNFTKHVHSQDESSLAKQVMDEQIVKDWPGLCKYADKVMDELEIDGAFSTEINQKHFKKLVKDACEEKNHESLKNSISEYKKMKALRDEVVIGNEYFYTEFLQIVRTLFKFRTDMFQAKENFKNT